MTEASIAHPPSGTQDNNSLSIPPSFDWVFGTAITVITLFFSAVWWMKGLSSKVEDNSSKIESIEENCIQHRQEMQQRDKKARNEIGHDFKKEIQQSASDICHGFELFAVEIRNDLKQINTKLDSYGKQIIQIEHAQDMQGNAIEKIGAKMDLLKEQVEQHEEKIRGIPRRFLGF